MMRALAASFVVALAVAACGGGPESGKSDATPDPNSFVAAATANRAQAGLANAQGSAVGSATIVEDRVGVHITLNVANLPPGKHGVHVHAAGKCEPPAFTTAGGHFNPDGKQHGALNPQGPHAGDLGNIDVDERGNGTLRVTSSRLSLGPGASNSLLVGGGLSIVVHAGPDDEKTDPAGNSGDRIACGLIKRIGS
ncbi:MAG: superoxide dismutase family protein [Candidatus Limnocylindria bacterium]